MMGIEVSELNVNEVLLAQFPAATWTLDRGLRVTSWAGSGLVALGLTPGDFVGRPIREFYEAFGSNSPPYLELELALAGVSSDVEVHIADRIFQAHLSPLRNGTEAVIGVIGVAMDVTERALQAERFKREAAFRNALTRFFGDSLRYAHEDEFYRRLLTTALDVVPAAQAGSIWLRGENGLFNAVAAVGFDVHSLKGLALRQDEILLVGGSRADIDGALEALGREDPELGARIRGSGPVDEILTTASIPVIMDGEPLAYLHLHSLDDHDAFDQDARAILDVLANEVAALLRHARLEHSLKRESARSLKVLADYKSLAAFGAEIETIHDTDALIELGMTRLLEVLQFDTAMFTDVSGGGVHFTRLYGAESSRLRDELTVPQPLGAGINGRVAVSGQPLFVRDYPTWPERYEPYVSSGVRSMIALPVRRGGSVRHTLALATLGRTVEVDENTLKIASGFVSRLENAFERLQNLQEIKATREATFRSLGVALEFRDLETAGHTDRVAALSNRFAAELNLDAHLTQALSWGAYLHDIGKLGVPDTILLKPGRLTDAEFDVIKKHTLHGQEMVSDIAFLPRETLQVVRSHHERWDGTGYPDQLAGEEIPLLARMFSIVDVYDALTSERSYKPAWSTAEAIAELRRQAGKQFDPRLVEVFLAILS